jgi:glycosyltransferase involved in cell wall biosynthesis
MTRVLHLIDDNGLGGVTRVLADHLPRLRDGFDHEIRVVNAKWQLPSRVRADIVVIHFTINWTKLAFLLALRARLPHARVVLVEHSYTEAYERLCVARPGRFRAMLRIGYAMTHRVVAVSAAQEHWLRQAGLVAGGKLVAIPQASDTSALTSLAPLTVRRGPLRLGAYGRYVRQKGFDVLIAAMRQVAPSVATLELAGQGADLAALQAAASGLPHVTIGGAIDGPASLLARIDVVVVPSRWEAFGLVAAEARAACRPVLAARTDGLTEQVGTGCGLLFPAENIEALAAAIRTLARCDLAAMGQQGRRLVACEFGETIARWTALLTELAPDAGRTMPVVLAPVR